MRSSVWIIRTYDEMKNTLREQLDKLCRKNTVKYAMISIDRLKEDLPVWLFIKYTSIRKGHLIAREFPNCYVEAIVGRSGPTLSNILYANRIIYEYGMRPQMTFSRKLISHEETMGIRETHSATMTIFYIDSGSNKQTITFMNIMRGPHQPRQDVKIYFVVGECQDCIIWIQEKIEEMGYERKYSGMFLESAYDDIFHDKNGWHGVSKERSKEVAMFDLNWGDIGATSFCNFLNGYGRPITTVGGFSQSTNLYKHIFIYSERKLYEVYPNNKGVNEIAKNITIIYV